MKILKVLGIIVLVLVVIGAIVFYSLPNQAHMERSVTINAKPAKVFAILNDLQQFNRWSPWYEKDPNATYTYDGSAFGVGARMGWNGNEDVGVGSMWIESIDGYTVNMGMDFGMGGEPKASYILKESDGSTEITWTFDQEMEGSGKIFGLMIDGFLGPDYENGLSKLKEYTESMPDVDAEVSAEWIQPGYYLAIKSKMPEDPAMISAKMGQMYGEIMTLVQTSGIEMAGAPFAVYEGLGTADIQMVAGIPVSDSVIIDSENVYLKKSELVRAVKAVHRGAYHKLAGTHESLKKYLEYRGITAGNPMEQYITDPMHVKDTTSWITNIYYPIASSM